MIPRACPCCRGEGFTRTDGRAREAGTRRPQQLLVRCRACGGTGEAGERRYLCGRRCACGRAFQPGAAAAGLALRMCPWCVRGLPASGRCRSCAAPLQRARTGRPPARCPACSPARRAYASRSARAAAGATAPRAEAV